MSTNHTQNYQLSQWVRSDKVLMEDFNADNARIDGALAGKADAAAVMALSQRVDGKADVSVTDSLAQTVASHTASLAGKGNCRIYTTSYTGAGAYGSASKNSLTFPARPVAVLIAECSGEGNIFLAFYGQPLTWSHGNSTAFNDITWSGNTMSWSSSFSAIGQMNKLNSLYKVVALVQL